MAFIVFKRLRMDICIWFNLWRNVMAKIESEISLRLTKIEKQIQAVLDEQIVLKQENSYLKGKLNEVSRAKAAALEKNIIAVQQIKKIIKQLKEEIA